MDYTRTDYDESILQRHIRAGCASNKSEVIQGPAGAGFRNADELEALLLQAGPATAMTPERKARIVGNLRCLHY